VGSKGIVFVPIWMQTWLFGFLLLQPHHDDGVSSSLDSWGPGNGLADKPIGSQLPKYGHS
jgi:hypothetical protein